MASTVLVGVEIAATLMLAARRGGLNVQTDAGNTAIHFAAEESHIDTTTNSPQRWRRCRP